VGRERRLLSRRIDQATLSFIAIFAPIEGDN
jgi:hypothetical protein